MKHTTYIGEFISDTGNKYSLTVRGNSFIQAFFLLTADAINLGRHYQLATITDDKENVRYVKDICKVSELLTF